MVDHKQVSLTLKDDRKIQVDVKLRNLIKALDEVGLTTLYSCQGGDDNTPAYIALSDTVDFVVEYSVLSDPAIPAVTLRWGGPDPSPRLKRNLARLKDTRPNIECAARFKTAVTYLKYVAGEVNADQVYLAKRMPSGKKKRFYIDKIIDRLSKKQRTSITKDIKANVNGFGDTPHLFMIGNELLCEYAQKLYAQLLDTAIPQFENGKLTYLGGFFKNGYVQLQAVGRWYLIEECINKGIYRISLRKLYPCELSPSRMLCVDVIVGGMSWTNPS